MRLNHYLFNEQELKDWNNYFLSNNPKRSVSELSELVREHNPEMISIDSPVFHVDKAVNLVRAVILKNFAENTFINKSNHEVHDSLRFIYSVYQLAMFKISSELGDVENIYFRNLEYAHHRMLNKSSCGSVEIGNWTHKTKSDLLVCSANFVIYEDKLELKESYIIGQGSIAGSVILRKR
jgi:hypothetical protein